MFVRWRVVGCQLRAFLLEEHTMKARPRRRTTRQLAHMRLIEDLLFIQLPQTISTLLGACSVKL